MVAPRGVLSAAAAEWLRTRVDGETAAAIQAIVATDLGTGDMPVERRPQGNGWGWRRGIAAAEVAPFEDGAAGPERWDLRLFYARFTAEYRRVERGLPDAEWIVVRILTGAEWAHAALAWAASSGGRTAAAPRSAPL